MKKSLLTLVACASAMMMQAQVVEVQSVEQVNVSVSVNTPCISPDGTFVVASTLSDRSLQRIDLATGIATTVTPNGSTLHLKFTPDGNNVIFRRSVTWPNRLRYQSIEAINLNNGKEITLATPSRAYGAFAVSPRGNLTVVAEGRVASRNIRGEVASNPATHTVGINRGHLVVTNPDGSSVNLDPQGKGSYLWPSISPDGTKVAYYLSGRGCFVCNLDGSDIRALGYIHAPAWCGNEMIVGQQDYDNGEVLTSSTIVISDLDGTIQKLTDPELIGLNPSASVDGSRIVFSTVDGKLYVINLK